MASRRDKFVVGRSAHVGAGRNLVAAILVLMTVVVMAAVPALGSDKAAPEFVLRSLDGRNLRLSELRGEVVMINFWASWCGGCRQAMPAFNELDEKYHRAGLTLLSVNVDEEEQRAESMSRSLKIRFPVLRDGQKAVSRLYKADTLPLTVLIDREGNVRYSHTGYNVGDEQKYVAELRTLLNE
jgi:thiol-disulfide isomerase/thioredoxin